SRCAGVPLGSGDRVKRSEPRLLRATPDLSFRYELIALAHAADADVVDLRAVAGGGGVDRGAATRAKALRALGAALRRLHVDRRLTGGQAETVLQRADRQAKRRAGQRLTVGAVPDRGPLRIAPS